MTDATPKGIPISRLPEHQKITGEEYFEIIGKVQDGDDATPTGLSNHKLGFGVFIEHVAGIITEREKAALTALQDNLTQTDKTVSTNTDAIRKLSEHQTNTDTTTTQKMSDLEKAIKDKADKTVADELTKTVGAQHEQLTNHDNRLTALEKTDGSTADDPKEVSAKKAGTNDDGYAVTQNGLREITAHNLQGSLKELGITVDVRLNQWFLNEGVLSEDAPAPTESSKNAANERSEGSTSTDPSKNPSASGGAATGGSGEKGNGSSTATHDSSGGSIDTTDDSKQNPVNPNADPSDPNYGKYWNNGNASDATAPYPNVEPATTQSNAVPVGATNPETGFSYLDALTSTKNARVVNNGNLEIAMLPVVRGADPVKENEGHYDLRLGRTQRWQVFVSVALLDTRRGSSILSLYDPIEVKLKNENNVTITFKLVRQGNRIVLKDTASGTVIYAGYQESDESTVQFLIRPEMFGNAFADYSVNDAGAMLGSYTATTTATYVTGDKMDAEIVVNAMTDGTYDRKPVYRPRIGPVRADWLKDNGSLKDFAYPTVKSVKGKDLTIDGVQVDHKGPYQNVEFDDFTVALGVYDNPGNRVEGAAPMQLATPDKNGGYNITIPKIVEDKANGLWISVLMGKPSLKEAGGTASAIKDHYQVAMRLSSANESNTKAGLWLTMLNGKSGTKGNGDTKYIYGETDGYGFDVSYCAPERNVYQSGSFWSHYKAQSGMATTSTKDNPQAMPFQGNLNLLLPSANSTSVFTATAKTLPISSKNPGTQPAIFYGPFNLNIVVQNLDTKVTRTLDIPINIKYEGE